MHPKEEMLNWWFVGGGMNSCPCSKAAGRCFPPGSGSRGMNLSLSALLMSRRCWAPCGDELSLVTDDGGGKLGINREQTETEWAGAY